MLKGPSCKYLKCSYLDRSHQRGTRIRLSQTLTFQSTSQERFQAQTILGCESSCRWVWLTNPCKLQWRGCFQVLLFQCWRSCTPTPRAEVLRALSEFGSGSRALSSRGSTGALKGVLWFRCRYPLEGTDWSQVGSLQSGQTSLSKVWHQQLTHSPLRFPQSCPYFRTW